MYTFIVSHGPDGGARTLLLHITSLLQDLSLSRLRRVLYTHTGFSSLMILCRLHKIWYEGKNYNRLGNYLALIRSRDKINFRIFLVLTTTRRKQAQKMETPSAAYIPEIVHSREMEISPTETAFETPIGSIAAKVWGPEDGRPVIAMHGWQDNAGTFDNLIPLLTGDLRIVAFDFLGHGLSSHKPPGETYRVLDHCQELQYVVRQLNWKRYTILAHSMGACVGLLYASMYPEEVVQFVSLDLLKPPTGPLSQLRNQTRRLFDIRMDLEEKIKLSPPSYPEEEALHRMVQGSMGSIDEKAAAVLMKRGVKCVDDEKNVVYTRDLRLRCSFLPKIDYDSYKAYAIHLKIELLVIKARNSHIQDPPHIVEELKNLYNESCTFFQCIDVPGTHHVHLNNPDVVASHINTFLARPPPNNESKL